MRADKQSVHWQTSCILNCGVITMTNKKQKIKPFEDGYEYLKEMAEYLTVLGQARIIENDIPPETSVSMIREDASSSEIYPKAERKKNVDNYAELMERADAKLEILDGRISITPTESDTELPLEQIAIKFDLDRFEVYVILIALASSINSDLENVVDELGRDCNVSLLLTFLCNSFAEKIKARKYFLRDGKLRKYGLIGSGHRKTQSEDDFLSWSIDIPRRISNFIFGIEDIDDELSEFVEISNPEVELSDVVLTEAFKNNALDMITPTPDPVSRITPILFFSGISGTGKSILAAALANAAGLRFMKIDIGKIIEDRLPDIEEHLEKIFSEACLLDTLLYFDGFDKLLSGNYEDSLIQTFFAEIEQNSSPVILSAKGHFSFDREFNRRITTYFDFVIPDTEQREILWNKMLPSSGIQISSNIDIRRIASRYELTGGSIRNAIMHASHAIRQDPDAPSEIRQKDLEHWAHSQVIQASDKKHTKKHPRRHFSLSTRRRNEEEEKLMDDITPLVSLDDVILPDELKKEIQSIVTAAKTQDIVFDKWGFGEKIKGGQSVSCIFYGKSGTGKTYTAEAITSALGRKLRIIRSSGLASKWVGETQKNISTVFREADDTCVLFFDEADSFFNERPTGSDQAVVFLTRVTNTLLKEIEMFKGVIILATNRHLVLDPAFERRIRYKLEFPLPGARAREQIWLCNFPDKAPKSEDVDFRELADRFDFTGGQIRNTVIRAACLAAEKEEQITQEILLRAAHNEKVLRHKSAEIGFA